MKCRKCGAEVYYIVSREPFCGVSVEFKCYGCGWRDILYGVLSDSVMDIYEELWRKQDGKKE